MQVNCFVYCLACSKHSTNIRYYDLLLHERLANLFLRSPPNLSSVIFCLIHLRFLLPRSCWKERKWVNFNLISFYCFSHQGTSNSWNGHRLTTQTADFIFSSFYGLFLCARHLGVCTGLQKMLIWKCLLISIASDLKLIALRPFLSSGDINGLSQVQDQSASCEMNLEEADRQI